MRSADPMAAARRVLQTPHAARTGVSTLELVALARLAVACVEAIDRLAEIAEDAAVNDWPLLGGDVLNALSASGLYSQALYDHNVMERLNGKAQT